MEARIRCILFRLAALLLALLTAALLGEIALRVAKPQETLFTGKGMYLADPEVGHVLKPNVRSGGVSTNSHGFRDREYPIEKPDGSFRIVGIGDSFTFGAGPVQDNFLDLLEERLNRSSLLPVEVINTGVAGYNTLQELKHFKKFGVRFSPDIVILGFFLGNDIIENEADLVFDVVDGELSRPHARPGMLQRLLHRSHLYRFLASSPVRAEEGNPGLPNFLRIELARTRVCLQDPPAIIEAGYRATMDRILDLRDYVERKEMTLIVLLIPDEFQVNPDLFQDIVAEFGLNPADYDLETPNRRLGEFLEREGILFVDPLASLKQRQTGTPVYIPENTHLNRAGNEVLADSLLELLRNGWPSLLRKP